jgi:hypothetical protein
MAIGVGYGTSSSGSRQYSMSGSQYDDLGNRIRAGLAGQQRASAPELNMRIGGHSGKGPPISIGPIWGPQQIDERVNLMRAGNDATAAGQMSQQREDLAGRGFSTVNSPLAMELARRTQAQNMATNTAGENDLRWNAAQGNAQHLLATQSAAQGFFRQMMDEDIRRRQLALQKYGADAQRSTALTSALAQMAQPLSSSRSSQTSMSYGAPESYEYMY